MKKDVSAEGTSAPTALRLFLALSKMAEENVQLTASELCIRAGVSRTALYAYHVEVVALLNTLKSRRNVVERPAEVLTALQMENDRLANQVTQIASVVDHYYTAWQEVSGLLRRRESELVDLRRKANPKITTISDNALG